jgi:hypothetical protein
MKSLLSALAAAGAICCAAPAMAQPPTPINCVGHYYVVDANGRCVGDVIGTDFTAVARHLPPCEIGVCSPGFGSGILYAINVNQQQGFAPWTATFLYPTIDCSGQAYMELNNSPFVFIEPDFSLNFWAPGMPASTITVQAYRYGALTGTCYGLGDPVALVGPAELVADSSFGPARQTPFTAAFQP